MASVEESLFISEFLAAYASQPTKFRTDYIPTGLAPNLTSKRVTFERPPKPVKAGAAQGDIQVTIKSLKSGQWTVGVPAQGTIADLKDALKAKAGIEVSTQRLLLKGKALVDNKRLEEYGLESGSVVHLFSKAGATDAPAAGSSSTQGSESTAAGSAAPEAAPSQPEKPALTSYRGLSEESTAFVREPEFWYWLNDQLKEKLASKEDANLMLKRFLGQYRDLIGNVGTKEIEKEIAK
ncbi:ubiquitin-related domain-containing protein [Mortierella sp. GBAus27b]|nr:hypothetical protein BGX31_000301 [Mortierella sp. GBA43]KAI8352995.1 ubiquitin-related domain-containing protein [Mortierella sp. GBAus27b]